MHLLGQKRGQTLSIGIIIGVCAGALVYAIVGYSLGVPLRVLFAPPHLLQINALPLDITIVPPTPNQVGQQITVLVKDGNNSMPIAGAQVTVTKDGNVPPLRVVTDANGRVEVTYLGVFTYITVEKDGYNSKQAVIPQGPDEWEQERRLAGVSWGITIVSSVGGAFLTNWLKKRPSRT